MTEDFFYALITGWFILAVFWATIIVFILIRKPPKSKLTNITILKSFVFFFILLLGILIFR